MIARTRHAISAAAMADRRMQANIQWFAPRPARLIYAAIIIAGLAACLALGVVR